MQDAISHHLIEGATKLKVIDVGADNEIRGAGKALRTNVALKFTFKKLNNIEGTTTQLNARIAAHVAYEQVELRFYRHAAAQQIRESIFYLLSIPSIIASF
ncbi:hypothetical protein GCM10007857_19970 [Bradyrhizobium iriomotense]|uniref:Uncharacterized protein n=1 Tax=Bradyrhizobium iriomotense TaxID=441950 RepID=A0ABQ6ASU7_9BRAD|nr:hypothetical protein GCM10007857_19970 [Bradyrhizobium iriomotense]